MQLKGCFDTVLVYQLISKRYKITLEVLDKNKVSVMYWVMKRACP